MKNLVSKSLKNSIAMRRIKNIHTIRKKWYMISFNIYKLNNFYWPNIEKERKSFRLNRLCQQDFCIFDKFLLTSFEVIATSREIEEVSMICIKHIRISMKRVIWFIIKSFSKRWIYSRILQNKWHIIMTLIQKVHHQMRSIILIILNYKRELKCQFYALR